MEFRDLEKVRTIIKNATGLDISYAYDDLVFPDNTAFIIQFDDKIGNGLFCYFHEDCRPADQNEILARLTEESMKNKYMIAFKGAFRLEQKGEEVEIRFN